MKKSQQAKWLIKPRSLWFHSTRVLPHWVEGNKTIFVSFLYLCICFLFSLINSWITPQNRQWESILHHTSAQTIWSMNFPVVHPASEQTTSNCLMSLAIILVQLNLTELMIKPFEPRTKKIVRLNDADMECIQARLFPAVSPPLFLLYSEEKIENLWCSSAFSVSTLDFIFLSWADMADGSYLSLIWSEGLHIIAVSYPEKDACVNYNWLSHYIRLE